MSQAVTQQTKSWLKSEIERELAGGVALQTRLADGQSNVEVYFPTSAQARKLFDLCQGYYDMAIIPIKDVNPDIGIYKNNLLSFSSADKHYDTAPMMGFEFAENQSLGASFIKDFGANLSVVTRDHNDSNYAAAEEQLHSLLSASKRVLGKK